MKVRKEADWGPRKYRDQGKDTIDISRMKDLPKLGLDPCEVGEDGKRREVGDVVMRGGEWIVILVVGWRPLNRFEYWFCVTCKGDRSVLPLEFDDTEEMQYEVAGVFGIAGENGPPPEGDDDAPSEEE